MKQNNDIMQESKNILKILTHNMFSRHDVMERVVNSVPMDERDNNSGWYLHGKLESDIGYDKAIAINCKTAGYSRETINWKFIFGTRVSEIFEKKPLIHKMHLNGEVPIEIDNISKKCVGFFWIEDYGNIIWQEREYPYWNQRGLVCYADDAEACEYARRAMNNRSVMI